MLTWPSPGNCCVPRQLALAGLAQTSLYYQLPLYYQLLVSLISKLDLNGEDVPIELSERKYLSHARNYSKENRSCYCFFSPRIILVTGKEI